MYSRLDKGPRRGAKQKRIKALLHEDNDLICKVSGAHIIGFVGEAFLGVLVYFHFIQSLHLADFNSR